MRRRIRSLIVTMTLLLLLLGAVGGVLASVLKHEPGFYNTVTTEPGENSGEKASQFLTRLQDLKNDIRSKADWGSTFRADDLNCFFHENFGETNGFVKLLPKSCHSPRLVIEGDRVKLGLRYGEGFWSTIVWIELRAWLVKNETNLVAMEICGLKAGGLPVGGQTLLDSITEVAHDSNVDVTWYRNNGNPVGLFRFYAGQLRPSTQIHTFRIVDGSVIIGGRTRIDTTQNTAAGLTPIGE
jgi:hypothetical protein